MTQNVNATLIKTPNNGATQITTGVGSNGQTVTVYTGGANGSMVPSFIAVAANTTAAFDVQWGTGNAGTFYVYGTVTIPAGAGNSGSVPSVNMFNTTALPGLTLNSDGNPFLFLASSAWALQARVTVFSSLWTAGAVINLIAPSVGDF